MTDRIRIYADDALAFGDKLGDLALQGHAAWAKNVEASLEATRSAMELGRDAQRQLARAMVDGVLPRAPEATKQA